MKPYIFTAPELDPDTAAEDIVAAWESDVDPLTDAADGARGAWDGLVHAWSRLCATGEALEYAVAALAEGCESVAEAALELRHAAFCARELEYLEDIDAPSLPQAVRHIREVRPPPELVGLVRRLIDRDDLWHADRDEAARCRALHDDAWARYRSAVRRFDRRRRALRQSLRGATLMRRAA